MSRPVPTKLAAADARRPRSVLRIENRQRTRPLNLRYFREIAKTLLHDLLAIKRYDLTICLVAAPEMTRLNETFLQHQGPTDVITFDYSEARQSAPCPLPSASASAISHLPSPICHALHGDIFICVDETLTQARRFRTTWQSELLRYLIHGILHLQGFDDHRPQDRRKMKREESRLLRLCSNGFDLRRVSGKT